MATGSTQPSSNIENLIKQKALFKRNNNLSNGQSGAEVLSGLMVGSSLQLNKSNGTTVTISDVLGTGNFVSEDQLFQNTDKVTQVEAQADWDAI
jgi:hypothetical protein